MNLHRADIMPYNPNPSQKMEFFQTKDDRTFIQHGYGMVGTGHSMEEARKDLLEKIRQAGER